MGEGYRNVTPGATGSLCTSEPPEALVGQHNRPGNGTELLPEASE